MSGRIEVEQIHGYGFRVSATDGRGRFESLFDVRFTTDSGDDLFSPKAAQELADSFALKVGRVLDVDATAYDGTKHWSSCPACTGHTFHRYRDCEAS